MTVPLEEARPAGGRCQASVVVPTRQRAAMLPGLVSALAGQEGISSFEIVIVDDASTDDAPDVLRALADGEPRLSIELLPRRGGPATARNVGWRRAVGDIVAFTDDDCVPAPTWLAELLAAHATGLDIVQGQTVADIPLGERDSYSNSLEIPAFSYLYQTCNISYRREILERSGGFDEAFGFSAGGAPNGEDADLGWRAAEAGARPGFAAGAVVVHPVTPRPFGRALLARLRAFRMVYFVRRHPGFRRHASARYFFQPAHPLVLLSIACWIPVLATRQPWFALVGGLGFVPYVHFRRRINPVPGRRRYLPALIAGAWVIDLAEVLVMLVASVRWRTVFL